MENLDYYTVMESKIRYYQQKYDPGNKLKQIPFVGKQLVEEIRPESKQVERKSKLRRKILARFDAVISVFL